MQPASPHCSNPSTPRTTPQPPPPPPPPNPLKRKTPPSEDEGRSFTPPEDGPSVPKGEYETGQVICEVCGVGVSFRDEATGGFTLKHWNDHRVSCVAPSPTATSGDPATHSPDVPADAMAISHPQHPPAKRRRAKRTEEERIEYLRADPYVAQFEAYRVLCASCDKWIRLRPNSTYCSIPWDAHRKSCLAKKINSKNVYALEERNTLFSKDPDVRKFDAERVLCNMCDQWLALNPEDHLHAVQTWLQHRSTCQKAATTLRASLHAAGQPSPPGSTSSPTTAALPPTAGSSHSHTHTHAAPTTTAPRTTSTSTSTSPPILSLSLSSLRSPSFHDLNPANYAPAHESRRRNAEQRAATLRADNLIGEVEPNRVFCSLCQKWVQLRQDSSYCAYPWLQHRGKCLARHQRRAQKAAEIAEAKARKLGHSHSHPHSHPHTLSHSNSNSHPHTSTTTSASHQHHSHDAMSVSSSASSSSDHDDHDDAESEEGVDPDPDPDVDREPQVKREPVDERRGERRHDQDRRAHPQQYHSHSHSHSHSHQHQHSHRQVQEQQPQPQPQQRPGQGQVHGQQQQQQQRPHSSSSASWHHSHPPHPHHVSQTHREQYPHSHSHSHHHHHHKSRSGGPTTGVYAQHLQHTGPSSSSASASSFHTHAHHQGHGQGQGQGNGHGHTHRPSSSSFRGPPPPPASASASTHVPQARVIRAWNAGVRVGGDDDAGGDADGERGEDAMREAQDRRGGGQEGGEEEREGEGEGEGEEDAEGSPYIEDDTERHAHVPTNVNVNGRKRVVMMVATAAVGRRALADLDSVAGRRQFVHASITHLFGTTYEATDEMRVAALVGYLNAAAPPDKHEDFDTAEVVRALAVLQERGRVRLEGDLVKIVV